MNWFQKIKAAARVGYVAAKAYLKVAKPHYAIGFEVIEKAVKDALKNGKVQD